MDVDSSSDNDGETKKDAKMTKLNKDTLLTSTVTAFVKFQRETEELSNCILRGKSESANSSPGNEGEDESDNIKVPLMSQFTSLAGEVLSS
ncbi:hypothetical protein M427DRAFT_160792 [Gonapodya prolifera JEL478]|uniref:Uncharacterized protein n=1 Tax=Gonapodya prolifera (strain JEL478) TaxID=1344416 RepID=A0A138ZXY0_GONPJ|nr:hypothetical protein M427DRAFT_160792 [Gonapodya prolifera JEL478]|eukprot:KXS09360.1 hypothetical protein M427DRAFT_160792 [Gonapodya prolifera JEL478]